MKFLVIFSLLGGGFPSLGKRKSVEMEEHLYPMVSTYASEVENCDVDDLNINSLSDVKNVCRSLINSEVCSNVKRKYLIDCDTLVLYKSQVESLGVDQAKQPGTSSLVRVDQAEPLDTSSFDNIKGVWIYSEAEADRLHEESVLSYFVTNFAKFEQEPEFSCLNSKGKMKVWRKYIPSKLLKLLSAIINAPSDFMNSSTMEEVSQGYLGFKIMIATILIGSPIFFSVCATASFATKCWYALVAGLLGGFFTAIAEEGLGVDLNAMFYRNYEKREDRNNKIKFLDSVKAMNSVRRKKIYRKEKVHKENEVHRENKRVCYGQCPGYK